MRSGKESESRHAWDMIIDLSSIASILGSQVVQPCQAVHLAVKETQRTRDKVTQYMGILNVSTFSYLIVIKLISTLL